MRITVLCGLVAGLVSAIGLAGAQTSDPPREVGGKQLSILLRTTMIALHHANITGNYSVLRDLGDLSFRNLNKQTRLADIFRPIREAKLDLSQTALIEPILSKRPIIDENAFLQMQGYFPIKPLAPIYKMAFRWENKQWRLFSISVGADKLENLQGKNPGKESSGNSQ